MVSISLNWAHLATYSSNLWMTERTFGFVLFYHNSHEGKARAESATLSVVQLSD